MATLFRTDGTQEEVKVPSLTEAQALVGGYVEVVRPKYAPAGTFFLCDEEGLLKGKPVNIEGCKLYGTLHHGQPIVGDIVVINRSEPGARSWIS